MGFEIWLSYTTEKSKSNLSTEGCFHQIVQEQTSKYGGLETLKIVKELSSEPSEYIPGTPGAGWNDDEVQNSRQKSFKGTFDPLEHF